MIVSLFKWQVVQRSVCQRDGRWFLKLLQAETDRMEGWCRQMELDQRENDLPEDSTSLCVCVVVVLHVKKSLSDPILRVCVCFPNA